MAELTYQDRRGKIEAYFDRTAVQAWARLTSDAPLGRIRSSVRAGRDRMRETLLGWLPADLHGLRILDAGCGTGALAVEAARRGAHVVAIDLSPTLVDLARERLPSDLPGSIDFRSGDMLDAALGEFDYVVGMDSLIHYETADAVRVLAGLAERTRRAVLFTYAPSNPALEGFPRCRAASSRAATAHRGSNPLPRKCCAARSPQNRVCKALHRSARCASRAASTPLRRWS